MSVYLWLFHHAFQGQTHAFAHIHAFRQPFGGGAGFAVGVAQCQQGADDVFAVVGSVAGGGGK